MIAARQTDDESADDAESVRGIVLRVAEVGLPAFQLRKGEEGISVFDPRAVVPPLTEDELLASFRPGSVIISRTIREIESKGLRVEAVVGADILPERLRTAHCEILPGAAMPRNQFKNLLKELE